MLLSYNQLVRLVETCVINGALFSNVNSSSIDIRLGSTIFVERHPAVDTPHPIIKLGSRDALQMEEIDITNGYLLAPGEFILAHSQETFNLPLDISAEYKMKSSMARVGLNHLTACWCDPGWQGSSLTMELKNETRHHSILLRAGDAIGQMVFFKHEEVPYPHSYAARGRYNHDTTVTQIKP